MMFHSRNLSFHHIMETDIEVFDCDVVRTPFLSLLMYLLIYNNSFNLGGYYCNHDY